jgi:3-keto-disaccharide hydrolase
MRRYLCTLVVALGLISLASAVDDVPAGFTPLFNGKDLSGWKVLNGKMDVWGADKGILFVDGKGGGWLMTEKEYGDFELRLEFKMPKMGNSGVALRAPLQGDPAYQGMEIQLLDDENYKGLKPTQYTGSIYDVVAPSKRVTKAAGEWQKMRIVAKGRQIMVELNGEKIVDANLDEYKDRAKADPEKKLAAHPGLLRTTGHLGLQSHDGRVEFRQLLIKAP